MYLIDAPLSIAAAMHEERVEADKIIIDGNAVPLPSVGVVKEKKYTVARTRHQHQKAIHRP